MDDLVELERVRDLLKQFFFLHCLNGVSLYSSDDHHALLLLEFKSFLIIGIDDVLDVL